MCDKGSGRVTGYSELCSLFAIRVRVADHTSVIGGLGLKIFKSLWMWLDPWVVHGCCCIELVEQCSSRFYSCDRSHCVRSPSPLPTQSNTSPNLQRWREAAFEIAVGLRGVHSLHRGRIFAFQLFRFPQSKCQAWKSWV